MKRGNTTFERYDVHPSAPWREEAREARARAEQFARELNREIAHYCFLETKMFVLAYAQNQYYASSVREDDTLLCARGIEKALTFSTATAAAQALYRHARRTTAPASRYPYTVNPYAVQASSERWEIVEVKEVIPVPQPTREIVGRV